MHLRHWVWTWFERGETVIGERGGMRLTLAFLMRQPRTWPSRKNVCTPDKFVLPIYVNDTMLCHNVYIAKNMQPWRKKKNSVRVPRCRALRRSHADSRVTFFKCRFSNFIYGSQGHSYRVAWVSKIHDPIPCIFEEDYGKKSNWKWQKKKNKGFQVEKQWETL